MEDQHMNMAEYKRVVNKCRDEAAKNQSSLNYFGKISRLVVDRLQAEGLHVRYYPARIGFDPIPEHFTISW